MGCATRCGNRCCKSQPTVSQVGAEAARSSEHLFESVTPKRSRRCRKALIEAAASHIHDAVGLLWHAMCSASGHALAAVVRTGQPECGIVAVLTSAVPTGCRKEDEISGCGPPSPLWWSGGA